MTKSKTLLLGLCLLLAVASMADAANSLGVYSMGSKGHKCGAAGLQMTENEDPPDDSQLADGRIYYDTTSGFLGYHAAAWVALSAAGVSADDLYNNGAWSVVADTVDVEFRLQSLLRSVQIYSNITGTHATLLELDAFHATSTVTDGLKLITTGASGVMTDAVDASDAGIVNAFNAGANVIIGTTTQVDFTDFDLSADGTIIMATDTAGATAMIDLAHAATVGTQVTGIKIQSGGAAITNALDLTDTDIVTAVNVAANAIVGTTGLINYSYFDVGAAGELTLTGAAADITVNTNMFTVDATNGNTLVAGTLDVTGTSDLVGNVTVTGDFTVSGTTNVGLGTWTVDYVEADTTNGTLYLDGEGSGGVTLNATGTGGILMTRNVTLTGDIDIDGGDITCPADLTITPAGGDVKITDDTASKPVLTIEDTTNDVNGPGITFLKDKGAAAADGDAEGAIIFSGDDAAQAATEWVKLAAEISDASNADEAGKFTISVMMDAGTPALKDMFMVEGMAAATPGAGQMILNNDSMDVDITIETDNDATFLVIDSGTSATTVTSTQTGTPLTIVADAVTAGNVIAISADALTTGEAIKIDSTSTAANDSELLLITSSGANGTATKTRTGAEIAMSGTGTTSTNIALSLDASGTNTNDALRILRGDITIGDATYDCGTLTFMDGAQSDETLVMSMAVGGDFTFDATSGDIVLDGGDGAVDISGSDLHIDSAKKLGLNGATLTHDFVYFDATDVEINAAADIKLNGSVSVDVEAALTVGTTTVMTGSLTVNGAQIIGDGATEIVGCKSDVVTDIDNEVLTIAESGTVFDNAADGDGTIFTLPEASTAIGCEYTFVVVAGFALNINPGAANDRFIAPITDAVGDSIQSSTAGDSVTVLCIGADSWVIKSAYPAASDWVDTD